MARVGRWMRRIKKTLWQGLFGISPYEHPPKGSVGRSLPLLVEMFSVYNIGDRLQEGAVDKSMSS
jgi:hypothetical protein